MTPSLKYLQVLIYCLGYLIDELSEELISINKSYFEIENIISELDEN